MSLVHLEILKALWLNSYDMLCSLIPFIGKDISHLSAFNHGLEPRNYDDETSDFRSVFFFCQLIHMSACEKVTLLTCLLEQVKLII